LDLHHNHTEETFHSILRDRVDIYRKTNVNKGTMNPSQPNFDDPDWLELEGRIYKLYQKYLPDDDALGFEDAAFNVVRPCIYARSKRDYEERRYVLDYQCGSLKYDKPKSEHPKRVGFHIANAISPQSIFADKQYLPRCLTNLMNQSAAEYDADELGTHTWLNSSPKWMKLFPAEWSSHMEPESKGIQWHFGYWGQFINARGTFNARLGRHLRETGELPFWPRHSWCSFASLQEHLLNIPN
jgi:hypothetical protein